MSAILASGCYNAEALVLVGLGCFVFGLYFGVRIAYHAITGRWTR